MEGLFSFLFKRKDVAGSRLTAPRTPSTYVELLAMLRQGLSTADINHPFGVPATQERFLGRDEEG